MTVLGSMWDSGRAQCGTTIQSIGDRGSVGLGSKFSLLGSGLTRRGWGQGSVCPGSGLSGARVKIRSSGIRAPGGAGVRVQSVQDQGSVRGWGQGAVKEVFCPLS